MGRKDAYPPTFSRYWDKCVCVYVYARVRVLQQRLTSLCNSFVQLQKNIQTVVYTFILIKITRHVRDITFEKKRSNHPRKGYPPEQGLDWYAKRWNFVYSIASRIEHFGRILLGPRISDVSFLLVRIPIAKKRRRKKEKRKEKWKRNTRANPLLTEQSGGRHYDDDGGQEHQDREPDGHHGFPRWFLFRCRLLQLLELLALRCRSRCNTVYEISTGGRKVGKKLRGKGFTRVTKRRSCPARKKLKSGHKAGRGSWIGDRLAVGTKTGDRIGHGDDEVPRHWPRCGGNNGQRTSSGWPGDLVWQPGTRRTYAIVLSTDPPLRPGRGAPPTKSRCSSFPR